MLLLVCLLLFICLYFQIAHTSIIILFLYFCSLSLTKCWPLILFSIPFHRRGFSFGPCFHCLYSSTFIVQCFVVVLSTVSIKPYVACGLSGLMLFFSLRIFFVV